MADFHELLKQIMEPSEDLPETIFDDLRSEYDALRSGSVAKVEELTAAQQADKAEIARLKAVNFDLLTASGVQKDSDADESDSGDDDDSPMTIDDLFRDRNS